MYNNRRPYVSIDAETTGLDPDHCQILEVGAVIDDWVKPLDKLPKFHAYVYHDEIVGQPYALQMNQSILRKIAGAQDAMRNVSFATVDGDLFLRSKAVPRAFADFLTACGGIDPKKAVLVAGKNFAGFDRPFLECLPGWNIPFHHRVIDPAMLYWNPDTDEVPPSLKRCMELAGIDGEVAHTAVEDALMVVKLVRGRYERNYQV